MRAFEGWPDVILRSLDIEKDLSIWSGVLGAQVSDWAGDAAYLRFDDAHHRIVLFPAKRPGILAVEYAVEDVNLLMRNYYVLRDLQIAVLHGPGRRPASEQLFLTFAGPGDVLFSFVAEGAAVDAEARRPRQFPAGPAGLCSWGSECKIGEFSDASHGRKASRSATIGIGVARHDQAARRLLRPARHRGSRWRDQIRHRLSGPRNRAPFEGRGLSQVRSARAHALLLRRLPGRSDRRIRSRRARRSGGGGVGARSARPSRPLGFGEGSRTAPRAELHRLQGSHRQQYRAGLAARL